MSRDTPVLGNAFRQSPEPVPPVATDHRRIQTDLPAPQTAELLARATACFPQVNCYQPPIVWERATDYQVRDPAGNCWIDFSSTAVMTNTGHGHPEIRRALTEHAQEGLLAQFSFLSEIRVRLAEQLLRLAPSACEKVSFWTVGSEAVEAALRLARQWGIARDPAKSHLLAISGDYHGWTLGAHQLSGASARKPWLSHEDSGIHHLATPHVAAPQAGGLAAAGDWRQYLDEQLRGLEDRGVGKQMVAGVFVEAMQGWGALPLPAGLASALRQWTNDHNCLLIFDEIQTGFGRTGKWFAYQHEGIEPDLLCIGKGLTSTLPLAAVLGPADVLDLLSPGEVTTTHAAHPMACAAALANLRVLADQQLVAAAARKGEIVRRQLEGLRQRFPDWIAAVHGRGLLWALHFRDPRPDGNPRVVARDVTWETVKRGVMVFQVNQPTLKVCPPLTIPDDALVEGIEVIGEALQAVAT